MFIFEVMHLFVGVQFLLQIFVRCGIDFSCALLIGVLRNKCGTFTFREPVQFSDNSLKLCDLVLFLYRLNERISKYPGAHFYE